MRRAARVTLPRTATIHAATPPATRRRRRPADEELKGAIVRPFVGSLAEAVGGERAKNGPPVGIHDGDDDLRPARDVEHDPVEHGPTGSDLHELSRKWWRVHGRS